MEQNFLSQDLLSDDIKLKYIRFLCETNPKKVLRAIKQLHIPLDDMLAICRHYNVEKAVGYLLAKQGDINQAF